MASVVAMIISVPFVMVLDRRAVLTIHSVSSSPEVVAPGGIIFLSWEATEHRNCSGIVYRRIVDSKGTVFNMAPVPTVYHDLMVLTPRRFSTSFNVPIGMATGPAKYISNTERWCNVLQEHIWPLAGPQFTVSFMVGL